MELGAEDQALVRQLFDDIDEDKSGVVDKGEMRQFLQLLPGNRTESEIAALFKGGDQDGSGTIEFEEFVSILTQAVKDMPPDEISRSFREAKEKSKEQMKNRRAMFEAKGSSSPPPPARKNPPPPPPPAAAAPSSAAPPAPSVDEGKYQRQIEDLQRQLEQAKTRIRDLESSQAKPCENCARLREELSKGADSSTDRTRQLERELRDLQDKHEKQQRMFDDERSRLQQHADAYRTESEHYQHELKMQEQTKCPQCLAVAKQQRTASGNYSPPTSPRDPTLALVGVQPRKDRGWSALSGSRRTTYCMGCGNAHRWAATPFVKEYSNRPGAGDAVEFYCRCCKKVNPRELRTDPPHQEQIRYPFTQGLYWYCGHCGSREPAGRPLGTSVQQNCSRCSKQATFEVREVPPARLIQMNKAAERALYCRGCREEECAMRWEPEGKEIELYCNKCRGVMAWEVRRRRV